MADRGDGWEPIETIPDDDRPKEILMSGGTTCIAPGLGRALNYHERKMLAKEGHWPDYKNFTPTHWRFPPKDLDHER